MTNIVSAQRLSRELVLAGFGMKIGNFDSWVIDRLTSVLEDVHLQAGQVLFAAGDPSELVYFMRDGEVRVTREGGPSWTLRGKWLLGSFEALIDRPHHRTMTALVDFEAMRVRRSHWVDLLEDSFQLARGAVMRTSAAVARLEERVGSNAPMAPRDPCWALPLPSDPLGTMDRLALLSDVRMLRGPGVQVLSDLAETSEEASFERGEIVLPRAAERKNLVIVVEGEVRATHRDPEVERHYDPGDLVCGAAAFGDQALGWEAVTVVPTRAITVPIEAWFDLMEEHFDLVRSTLAALARRREILIDHLAASEGSILLT
jgi:CRP-like cAMP-binding protein